VIAGNVAGLRRVLAATTIFAERPMGLGGKLVKAAGISSLPPALQFAIREHMESLDGFRPENDL
jgi:hypothetical protein